MYKTQYKKLQNASLSLKNLKFLIKIRGTILIFQIQCNDKTAFSFNCNWKAIATERGEQNNEGQKRSRADVSDGDCFAYIDQKWNPLVTPKTEFVTKLAVSCRHGI